MSDLLSSASLLLAVLGVLYGLWYPEIIDALKRPKPTHTQDYGPLYRKVESVLYGRALPLTIAAVGASIIFLPDAIKIIVNSILAYRDHGIANISNYSAVHTAFCFVVAMSMAIAVHLTMFSVKLKQKHTGLRPNAEENKSNKD